MNKPISAYKAVFFDAGDTLITIPEAHEIMRSYLEEREFIVEAHRLERVLFEAISHFYTNKSNYTIEACTPETDRQFWIEIYTFIMSRIGAYEIWNEETIHRCCHEMYEVFIAPEHYSLFEDVKDCLEALAARGQRIGLISNFAPTLKEILRHQGILHYFDPVIVSTEVGLEKPNPAIFLLALKQSGLSPGDVVYIGDHETNDIWAPQKVGIDAVRIIRYATIKGNGIRSLRELI